MTDWKAFFQILTMHRAGYRATLSLDAAVRHPDEQGMARRLHMVPLPEGHHIGLSDQVVELISESTP